MPVHDWSRVEKFVFHDFRATWIGMLRSALNTGVLPVGYYALVENASRHRRLTVRDAYQHRLVAIVEIVAPDRKDSKKHVQELLIGVENYLAIGVNLLIVDLFKPGVYDPHGLADAIWKRLSHEMMIPSTGEPLTIASYVATKPVQAYLDPYAVGQTLRDMPLSLGPDTYVAAPLEATYQTTWRGTPKIYREMLERSIKS